MFLREGVLKICSKFTGEHPCRSVISVKLQSNFIEITLCHGCSPGNLLHIFRTPFSKNTSGWLLPLIVFDTFCSRIFRETIFQCIIYFNGNNLILSSGTDPTTIHVLVINEKNHLKVQRVTAYTNILISCHEDSEKLDDLLTFNE